MTISKKTRHAVYDTHIHLVFITKYRREVFTDEMLTRLEEILSSVSDDLGAEIEEFNGESDHVHVIVSLPPALSIAKLVNSLKGVSSRLLRKEFSEKLEKDLWGDQLWSRSYYAGTTGGASIETLKKYIQNQDRPK